MRLRKIPDATSNAWRPTPGCATGAGGPSGLAEVVMRVFVPCNLVYKRERHVPQVKLFVSGAWNLHYTEQRTAVNEGISHAFRQHSWFFGWFFGDAHSSG
jgi:hypothetical protein